MICSSCCPVQEAKTPNAVQTSDTSKYAVDPVPDPARAKPKRQSAAKTKQVIEKPINISLVGGDCGFGIT